MSGAFKRQASDFGNQDGSRGTASEGRGPRILEPWEEARRGSVQPDPLEKLAFFLPLAEQGYVIAQNNVADMYYYGSGVDVNYEEAAKWYGKAAHQGDANAQRLLGFLHAYGKGVEQDYAKAQHWYRQAADQGNVYAQVNLGLLYQDGHGVEQDYAEARRWYERAAEKDDEGAQGLLGYLYAFGLGVEQDYAEARRWYELAAKKGDASALRQLGGLYHHGRGVEQNYAEARRWYELAIEKGNDQAHVHLALLYSKGLGGEKNTIEARRLLLLAARVGNEKAELGLGLLYHLGDGIEQDYAEARRWYERAAEKGEATAQYCLGTLHYHGNGVERNYAEARRWYERAAAQGHADAQYNLGILYGQGDGVDVDDSEARRWFERAAAQGHALAKKGLSILDQTEIEQNPSGEQEVQNTIEETPEKAQNQEVKTPEIPLERFMVSDILLKATNDLLEKSNIPEEDRPTLAAAVTQLIEDWHNNPEVAKARIAAMHAVQAHANAEPQTWQNRIARPEQQPAANVPPPPTKAPERFEHRKNKREGVDAFIQRVYKPWVVADAEGGARPVLAIPRKHLAEIDDSCDQGLSKWSSNHKGGLDNFPVMIDRKNGISLSADISVQEARSVVNKADYQRRKAGKAADARLR